MGSTHTLSPSKPELIHWINSETAFTPHGRALSAPTQGQALSSVASHNPQNTRQTRPPHRTQPAPNQFRPCGTHKFPSFPKSPTFLTFPNPSPAYPQEIPKLPQSLTPKPSQKTLARLGPFDPTLIQRKGSQDPARDAEVFRRFASCNPVAGAGKDRPAGTDFAWCILRLSQPRSAPTTLERLTERWPKWRGWDVWGRHGSGDHSGAGRQRKSLSGGRWAKGTHLVEGWHASAPHPQGAFTIGLGGVIALLPWTRSATAGSERAGQFDPAALARMGWAPFGAGPAPRSFGSRKRPYKRDSAKRMRSMGRLAGPEGTFKRRRQVVGLGRVLTRCRPSPGAFCVSVCPNIPLNKLGAAA